MYEGSFGRVSNREDWEDSVEVIDQNGDDVDISSAEITLAVRAKGCTSPVLTAEVGDGITVSSPRFTFLFDDTDMRAVTNPGQYDVGCVVTIGSVTTQLILGTVQIVDGVVS